MKPRSTSTTIKNAKQQKFFSWISITISAVGIPTILLLVPPQHQTIATILLTAAVTGDSVYGVGKSQPTIIKERDSKGDLTPDKETEQQRRERLSLPEREIMGQTSHSVTDDHIDMHPQQAKQLQMIQARRAKKKA